MQKLYHSVITGIILAIANLFLNISCVYSYEFEVFTLRPLAYAESTLSMPAKKTPPMPTKENLTAALRTAAQRAEAYSAAYYPKDDRRPTKPSAFGVPMINLRIGFPGTHDPYGQAAKVIRETIREIRATNPKDLPKDENELRSAIRDFVAWAFVREEIFTSRGPAVGLPEEIKDMDEKLIEAAMVILSHPILKMWELEISGFRYANGGQRIDISVSNPANNRTIRYTLSKGQFSGPHLEKGEYEPYQVEENFDTSPGTETYMDKSPVNITTMCMEHAIRADYLYGRWLSGGHQQFGEEIVERGGKKLENIPLSDRSGVMLVRDFFGTCRAAYRDRIKADQPIAQVEIVNEVIPPGSIEGIIYNSLLTAPIDEFFRFGSATLPKLLALISETDEMQSFVIGEKINISNTTVTIVQRRRPTANTPEFKILLRVRRGGEAVGIIPAPIELRLPAATTTILSSI